MTARLAKSALPDGHQYSTQQFDSAATLLDAIARRKLQLDALKSGAQDALSSELQKFEIAFASARKIAADKDADAARRASAAKLLGRDKARREEDVQILSALLTPQTATEIQRAAVKALAQSGADDVPATLARGWRSHMPPTRAAIVDELLSRDAWALDFLKRIEAKEIPVLDIDAQRRDRLLKHKSAPIKTLAQKVFADVSNPDRQKVIDNYSKALELKGDLKNGSQVFSRACAVCHKFDGVGNEIGPDLRSVTAHAPEKLLASILDPNRSIEPGFTAFLCTLNDGVQVYGIIKSESANSIMIKAADNNERTIMRSEIKQLRSTQVSLMPEGLEATITPQEMADLIGFLKSAPPESAKK